MLPDDYIRKMKQALDEVEVEAKTSYVAVVPSRPRRATSESYHEPIPDDLPLADYDDASLTSLSGPVACQ
jgi:hypothetical protein